MKTKWTLGGLILILILGVSLLGCGGEETAEEAAEAATETEAAPERASVPAPAPDPEKAKKIQDLVAKLDSGDQREAYDAVLKLAMMGDATAVDPLISVAQRETGMMRVAALKALGNIGDKRALYLLLDGLRDTEVDVRRNAASGLGNMNDASVFDPLIGALRDDDGWVKMNAQGSLEKLTGQKLQGYDAWQDWYARR